MRSLQNSELPSAKLLHMGGKPPSDAVRFLKDDAALSTLPLQKLEAEAAPRSEIVIVDVVGMDEAALGRLAAWRWSPSGLVAPLILIVDDETRREVIRRGLNEGANLIRRPLDQAQLQMLIRQLSMRQIGPAEAGPPGARQARYDAFPRQAAGLQAGDLMLDGIFGAWATGEGVNAAEIMQRSSALIDCLGQAGLSDWVVAVRAHHDSTYQHCLLVTGTLVAIGHALKMRRSDLGRLALGGLLHDIGKADIPLTILDKPAALTPHELAVMRSHPLAGVERLAKVSGITPDVVALVRDHHELIDGSGYPNGIAGDEIGDFVRLLTIADIYAALIERRSYKQPLSAADAIDVLKSMKDQIDQAFLAAITPVLRDVRN
jgi:putative nucleotidyltransferase with HDIG domain